MKQSAVFSSQTFVFLDSLSREAARSVPFAASRVSWSERRLAPPAKGYDGVGPVVVIITAAVVKWPPGNQIWKRLWARGRSLCPLPLPPPTPLGSVFVSRAKEKVPPGSVLSFCRAWRVGKPFPLVAVICGRGVVPWRAFESSYVAGVLCFSATNRCRAYTEHNGRIKHPSLKQKATLQR